jgi:hypothetical protein
MLLFKCMENNPPTNPVPQSNNPQSAPPKQSIGGEKVLQPSKEIVQEVQSAQQPLAHINTVNAAAVQSPPAQQATSSAYKDSTPQITSDTIAQTSSESGGIHYGIYVIVGLLFIGSIADFVSGSSIIGIISILINICLAIGLLAKVELIRKIFVVIGCLIIVVRVLTLIAFATDQHKASEDATKLNTVINNTEKNHPFLTPQQLNYLNAIKAQSAADQKTLKKDAPIFYAASVLDIVFYGVVIAYLSKPGVKAIFTESKSKIQMPSSAQN